MQPKAVYSTTEAARLCGVGTKALVTSIDAGHLPCFRIPGSPIRRIPHASLVRFAADNGIPLRFAFAAET